MTVTIIFFIIIAVYDLPSLIKTKNKGGLAVYLALYVFLAVVSFLYLNNIKIKSPLMELDSFIRDTLHLSYPA